MPLYDTALSKLPTVTRNIWRGVLGDVCQDLKKNEELTWWNVSSCSLSVDVIKDYLSSETHSTLFLIEAVHGKDISRYTNYPDEDEVLLAPGIQLRVIASATDLPGGLNVVHLAEVNDSDSDKLWPSPEIHVLPKSAEKDTSSEY